MSSLDFLPTGGIRSGPNAESATSNARSRRGCHLLVHARVRRERNRRIKLADWRRRGGRETLGVAGRHYGWGAGRSMKHGEGATGGISRVAVGALCLGGVALLASSLPQASKVPIQAIVPSMEGGLAAGLVTLPLCVVATTISARALRGNAPPKWLTGLALTVSVVALLFALLWLFLGALQATVM